MIGKRFFRLLHDVHRRFRQIIERRLRQSLVIKHKGDDSEGNRAVHNSERKHLKALAKAAASKKAEMVHLKEVLALTGYQRGGCSPLGAKKEYPVFLDASAKAWDKIAVSAGRRGEQIVLAPADLERAVHATTAQLTR